MYSYRHDEALHHIWYVSRSGTDTAKPNRHYKTRAKQTHRIPDSSGSRQNKNPILGRKMGHSYFGRAVAEASRSPPLLSPLNSAPPGKKGLPGKPFAFSSRESEEIWSLVGRPSAFCRWSNMILRIVLWVSSSNSLILDVESTYC